MKPSGTLKRVELTYDNGYTEVLKGKDANKWYHSATNIIIFASTHGYCMPELPWRELKVKQK